MNTPAPARRGEASIDHSVAATTLSAHDHRGEGLHIRGKPSLPLLAPQQPKNTGRSCLAAQQQDHMDPSQLPPPPPGLAKRMEQAPAHCQSLPPPPAGRSCGTVTSKHIQWVSELRSRRGRWSSEVQGPWTETENAYFEYAYELFRAGLLRGIEVGLPLRFFMSELLG